MNDEDEDYDADRLRRLDFWDSLRSWFEEQGYFLFEFVDDEFRKCICAQPTREYPDEPRLTLDDNTQDYMSPIPDDYHVEDPFPYAFMGRSLTRSRMKYPPYTYLIELEGKIMYAQDVKGRHVVLKKVNGDSDEYKIFRLLKERINLRDRNSFPYAEVGNENDLSTFLETFHDAIQYLISLPQRLAFLHELRIFHKDIAARNILVNHFSSYAYFSLQLLKSHQYLQTTGDIKYALTDFDLAMLLDEKTYGTNPRLPIDTVWLGRESRPYELMYAHVDFDPFKYDVACLGIYFTENFQHIITDVPLLAPLIDRMLTPDIGKRFTASEAVAFAQTIPPTISSLGQVQTKREPSPPPYYAHNRWAGLPESFVKEWGSYRVKTSWAMRYQNRVFNRSERDWYRLYYFRYTIHILTFVPRFICRHLLSLVRHPARSIWLR